MATPQGPATACSARCGNSLRLAGGGAERAARDWPPPPPQPGRRLEAAASKVALRNLLDDRFCARPTEVSARITGEEVNRSGARSGFRPHSASANEPEAGLAVEQEWSRAAFCASLGLAGLSLLESFRPPGGAQLDQAGWRSCCAPGARRHRRGGFSRPSPESAPRPGPLDPANRRACSAGGVPAGALFPSCWIQRWSCALLVADGEACAGRPALVEARWPGDSAWWPPERSGPESGDAALRYRHQATATLVRPLDRPTGVAPG